MVRGGRADGAGGQGGQFLAEGSKTEKATPKKRRDERKKGNTFLSQDAVAVATLTAAVCMLFLLAKTMTTAMGEFIVYCLSACESPTGGTELLREIEQQASWILAKTVLPIMLVTGFCAVAVTLAQTKFLVSGELLRPKFSRISPKQGIKRLFSLKSVIDALKGVVKITLLLVIVYLSLKSQFLESAKYLYTDIGAACRHLFESGKSMAISIIIAFIVIAALDFMYQWWEYERQLRMSKQEIKEEYKQIEGDPQIKGKIKENQRKMAQRRMMQQVPHADVVIRNPTHFAVALKYEPDSGKAPVVIAKGADYLAFQIRDKAKECNISVVENKPLARIIYHNVDIGMEIPPELYYAVAEILASVLRTNNR